MKQFAQKFKWFIIGAAVAWVGLPGIIYAVNVTVPQSTQKADVLVGNANGTYRVLNVGSDGACLIASSTTASGLVWGSCAAGGGSGITSLNGLLGASQTFATGTATGIGLTVTSAGSTHTFTPTVTSGYNIPLTASTTQWSTFYSTGTTGYVSRWVSNTNLGIGVLRDNGTVAGVNATSSTVSFNIQGSGTLNPFVVASSSGTALLTVAANGSTTLSSLGTGIVRSASGALYNGPIDVSSDTNLTVSATGLQLSADAIALAAGYNIPLSASTTNWNGFYDVPSTRITAGTNLAWSGNTLNGTMASSTIIAGGTATHSPSITIATSSDTNLGLQVVCATATCTFTPQWIGTLAAGRLNSNVVQGVTNDTNVTGSISAQNLTLGWTGQLSVARGGTATSSSPTAIGQLLAAHGSGSWGVVNLVAGANVTLTTSTPGQITIAATGGSGSPGGSPGQVQYNNAGAFAGSAALLTNGTVSGVNATSSTVSFNVQGSGTLNPLVVASSTGTQILTVTGTSRVGVGTSSPVTELALGSGQLFVPLGSGAAPSIAVGQLGTGIYGGANILNIATDGAQRIAISNGLTDLISGRTSGTQTLRVRSGVPTNAQITFYDANNTTADEFAIHYHLANTALSLQRNFGGTLTDRFVLNSAGNIGIGTSTPIGHFAVQGTSGSTTPVMVISSSSGLSMLSVGADNNIVIQNEATPTFAAGTQKMFTVVGSQTGGVARIVRNVGNGVLASSFYGTYDVTAYSPSTTLTSWPDLTGPAQTFSIATSGMQTALGDIGARRSGNDTTGDFLIRAYNSGSPNNGAAFQVNGNTSYVSGYMQGAVGAGYVFTVASSSSAILMTVSGNGSVGIGTNTTASTLTVHGTSTRPSIPLLTVASSSGTSFLTVAANGSTTLSSLGTGCVAAASGSLYIGGASCGGGSGSPAGSTGEVQFNNGGSFGASPSFNWSNSNGRLGINTTTPAATLSVRATSTEAAFVVASSSGKSYMTIDRDGNTTLGSHGNTVFAVESGALRAFFSLRTPAIAWNFENQGNDNNQLGIGYLGNFYWNLSTAGRMAVGSNPGLAGSSIGSGGNMAVGLNYYTLAAPINGLIVQGNTGIGTTSPLGRLVVTGASGTTTPTFLVTSSTNVSTFQVNSDGKVGIASSTPGFTFSLAGTAGATGLGASTAGNALCILATGEIVNAGNTTCATSSERFKENINPLEGGTALDILSKLNVYEFNYKPGYLPAEEKPESVGYVAEQVEGIDSRLVDHDYEGRPQGINIDRVSALQTKVIQGHEQRITQLEEEIAQLKNGGVQQSSTSNYWGLLGLIGLIPFITKKKENN